MRKNFHDLRVEVYRGEGGWGRWGYEEKCSLFQSGKNMQLDIVAVLLSSVQL